MAQIALFTNDPPPRNNGTKSGGRKWITLLYNNLLTSNIYYTKKWSPGLVMFFRSGCGVGCKERDFRRDVCYVEGST